MRAAAIRATGLALLLAWAPCAVGQGAAPPSDANGIDWASFSVDDLLWMAKGLAGDGAEVRSGRAELAGHIQAKCLADAASARSISPAQWNQFVGYLAADLTADVRAQWIARIRAAYAADAAGLAELKGRRHIDSLVGALGALGDAQAGNVRAAYTEGSDAWKSWSAADHALLAESLAALGDSAAAARQRVAVHVAATHLADAAATKAIGPRQWRQLAAALGPGLSEQGKADWLAALKAAFGGEGLQPAAFNDLAAATKVLGDGSSVATWMAANPTWQSWDAGALANLAGSLARAGGAAAPSRRALAEHVRQRFLTAEAATRSIEPGAWRRLAECLAGDLTDAVRAEWLTKIRGAFTADLSALKARRGVEDLIRALDRLGDPQAAALAIAYVHGSEAWQAWSPGEVSWLAGRLKALGDSAQGARQKLVQHVGAAHLADAAKAKAVGAATWRSLAGSLVADVAEEDRAAWAAKLMAAFAASPDDLTQLKPNELSALGEALRHLGAQDREASILVTIVTGSEHWHAWDAAALATLVRALATDGDSGAKPIRTIVAHVEARHLANDAAARANGPQQWRTLASALARHLTAEEREQWSQKIRIAYATGDGGLNSLNYDQVRGLHEALGSLGDVERFEWTASWATSPEATAACGPGEMAWLLGILPGRQTATASAARHNLAGQIQSKHLAGPEAVAAVNLRLWQQITRFAAASLPGKERAKWRAGILAAFAGNDEALGKLSGEQFEQLTMALRQLSGEGDAGALAVRLVTASEAWRQWDVSRLGRVASTVRMLGSEGKAAQRRLADHLSATHLADGNAVRAIQLRQWRSLAASLRSAMPQETRALWVERIRQAYAANAQALGALDSRDLRGLVQAVAVLDDDAGAALGEAWLNDGQAWREASTSELAEIAALVALVRAGPGRPLVAKLEKVWLARHAADALSQEECELIREAWSFTGDMAKVHEWAIREYQAALGTEQARKDVDCDELLYVSQRLVDVRLTGKGKGYAEFAATLARLALEGKLNTYRWRNATFFAAPLGTAETVQTLRDVLLDGEGLPRPVVAKTLAWAYRARGEMDAWRAYVDQRLADAPGGTDARALWLLAKAHNEALGTRGQNIRRSKRWIEQALASARSPAVRILALTDLASYCRWIGRASAALRVLDSVRDQFAGADLEAVDTLRSQICR